MKTTDFRVNNFDLIRLLAALQVAFMHAHAHLKANGGDMLVRVLEALPGVPIFFVISGFLISASWERGGPLRQYLTNRFLRIYPGLWTCFAVSLATVFALYTFTAPATQFVPWVLAQLSIAQFYNPDFLRGYGVGVLNGSLWTIPVELQFYLLLPVIYWTFSKMKWSPQLVAAVMLCLIGINQLFVFYALGRGTLMTKLLTVTVAPYLYMFLLGVLLQRNFPFVKKYLAGHAPVFAALYALVTLAAVALGLPYGGNNLNPVSAAVLALLVVSLAYTRAETFGNVLRGNDISYGVYIYHMVWVNALLVVAPEGGWRNLALALFLAIASAIVSWRLVERPALGLKRGSLRQHTRSLESLLISDPVQQDRRRPERNQDGAPP